MSSSYVRQEPLSAEDTCWLKRSVIVQACVVAFILFSVVAFFVMLAFNFNSPSLGELLFIAAVAVLVIVLSLLLSLMVIRTGRDLRAKEKLVIKGKVTAVNVRMSSYGTLISIRIGDKFLASDPLYLPVPGYMGKVSVGETVIASYLLRSGRTLSVVPAT